MTMSTVQDIENAIATLSSDDLHAWLERNRPHPFDERIEADLDAGLLDKAILRALGDERHGRTQPL